MLRRWMRLKGVSRTQRMSGRRSLRQTSAARSIRLEAIPLAIPASVPMVQGRTIMPSEGVLPLAMLAPMSASACWTILEGEAWPGPRSFSARALRPLRCISSAKTRSDASLGMKSTFATRASAWRARSISAAKMEPLAPVTARVSLAIVFTKVIIYPNPSGGPSFTP